MKKRLLCTALLLTVLLTLAGCGEKETVKASVDVDLTALSSTMVYSEVYNMLTAPDTYIGKTVKMTGSFSAFLDQNTGTVYYVCMIADATACCAQGMEFILKTGLEYPELESDITVTGTFETYDENGTIYCHLVDAELV